MRRYLSIMSLKDQVSRMHNVLQLNNKNLNGQRMAGCRVILVTQEAEIKMILL
jgi:hypothetical protein